jgi:hypothetical protein
MAFKGFNRAVAAGLMLTTAASASAPALASEDNADLSHIQTISTETAEDTLRPPYPLRWRSMPFTKIEESTDIGDLSAYLISDVDTAYDELRGGSGDNIYPTDGILGDTVHGSPGFDVVIVQGHPDAHNISLPLGTNLYEELPEGDLEGQPHTDLGRVMALSLKDDFRTSPLLLTLKDVEYVIFDPKDHLDPGSAMYILWHSQEHLIQQMAEKVPTTLPEMIENGGAIVMSQEQLLDKAKQDMDPDKLEVAKMAATSIAQDLAQQNIENMEEAYAPGRNSQLKNEVILSLQFNAPLQLLNEQPDLADHLPAEDLTKAPQSEFLQHILDGS